MPSAVPAGVYGRRIPVGGLPIPAAVDPSAAFRITMAAIDPSAEPQIDEEHKVPRATLRIIRVPMDLDDEDYDEEDDEDFDGEDVESIIAKLRAGGVALPEEDDDSEDDSEEEANGGPSDKAKSKKAKEAALKKKLAQDLAEDEMEIDAVNGKGKGKGKISAEEDSDEDSLDDDEDDDEDDEEDEVEEFVLCTLDPERNFQQPLDITVREGEEVYLQVDGTHDVFVTGNYVAFPEDDDEDEDDYSDEEDYDLYGGGPEEDELDLDEMDESEDDELDGLEDPRITEVDSEEEAPKLVASKKGKKNNKRAADEAESLDDLISKAATNGDAKAAKKVKKNDGQAVAAEPAKKAADTPTSDKKKVQFSKNLEMGPTGSPRVDEKKEAAKPAAKGPRNVSGVTVDDKKEGKGKAAKKGDRVEMRYIGKLKNGKVFDSNKKGKPFAFKLGVGQVIKGWDVGVAGMTAGGERRLTIPAAMAYGKKGAPPDIPPNSDLIFDIKCISVN